jgi:membrane protein DedA with SNARE-associated domain
MLEILALVYLTRKIGRMVEEKGRKGGWYKALTVFLWIGGEIVGAVLGAILAGGEESILLYLFALMGAAAGAGTAYLIAASLSPLNPLTPPVPGT